MAKYHEHLKHHEDEIEKHKITDEELKFLSDLQKELNTQDNLSQANPRFWIIRGSEKEYNIAGDSDGFELYDRDCCDSVAENMEGIAEYLRESILEEVYGEHANELIKVETEQGILSEAITLKGIDMDSNNVEEVFEDEDEVLEWLKEQGFESLDITYYKTYPKVYPSTMFLTQIDAENHLKANYYHYSDDAHTYAMTAWRDPRMSKLIDILQTVNWE